METKYSGLEGPLQDRMLQSTERESRRVWECGRRYDVGEGWQRCEHDTRAEARKHRREA